MNVSVHHVNVCVCAYALYDYQCALYEGMCVCCYLVNKSEAKSHNGSSSNQKKVVIFAPDLDVAAPSSWNSRELGRRGLTQHRVWTS